MTSLLSLQEAASLQTALAIDEAMMLRLDATTVVVQVNQAQVTRDLVAALETVPLEIAARGRDDGFATAGPPDTRLLDRKLSQTAE